MRYSTTELNRIDNSISLIAGIESPENRENDLIIKLSNEQIERSQNRSEN